MPTITELGLQPLLPCIDSPMSYFDQIVGAAVFDLNGLPREYLTTSDNSSLFWVQTIFQALGLRSLLMSSLQLEGFHHATIHGSEHCAVVVKQKNHYTALLISSQGAPIDDTLIEWVKGLKISELKKDPRFRVE